MSNKTVPKETNLRKWKDQFSWLKIIDVGGKRRWYVKFALVRKRSESLCLAQM